MLVSTVLTITLIFVSLKFLFAILSLCMLYMSGFPCGDGRACNESERLETLHPDAQTSHEQESESCTPFCICNCCNAASFIYSNTHEQSAVAAVEKEQFFSLPHFLESYDARTVWQPPRA